MVYRKNEFAIDLDSILPLFGKRFEKILAQEKNRNILEKIMTDFSSSIDPVLIWRRFPIDFFKQTSVVLEGNIEIGGGPVTHVFDGAEEVVLGVCTIGPEPERLSRQALKKGETIYSMLMDLLGSWGADHLKSDFYKHITETLRSEGFRASTVLAPGESDWDVRDQRKIFELVEDEAAAADMQITESGLLKPIKSVSFMFGLGKKPIGHENADSCAFCNMREKCEYRKFRT